ncbi:MAG: c-type cytochrome biogenesis protein CcmI [Pseudomonadota bacterium]
MTFWIVTVALTGICLAIIWRAFLRRPQKVAPDVDVYRDQLREVERDAARGVLDPSEAEAARTEVARRLLSADKAAQDQTLGGRGNATLGAVLTLLSVTAITGGTYWLLGAPGYPDLPLAHRIEAIEASRAERPSQQAAEAQHPAVQTDPDPAMEEMAAQLRQVLSTRPDDLQGWQLAVRTEAGLGNFPAAWRAQDRVIAIKTPDAASPQDFALLAELMIAAAGGFVSPEAERALVEVLRRDPGNGSARYYAGLMYVQGGRPDLAWPIWRRLVGESPENAPWLPAIYDQIEQVSQAAGDPTPLDQLPRPGTAARGPSGADLDAAAEMSMTERMEMIEGMVGGLAERLATEGGPLPDWARLIQAYGVLGRLDAAAAVYAEAQLVFADDQTALDTLASAADRAGLNP